MEATKGARDGRTVRAERTRQALVDALLALLYEGELQPTAERIAERAGVSERSVFQHFADREVLYQAVAVQQYERIVPTLQPIDASLPLAERIDAFVEQRTQLLETVTPVRRAALLLEPESEVVAGWLQSTRRQKAREIERVFRTELERVGQPERGVLLSALVAASAWTSWESLRAHQRLSVERSRAAMAATLTALLAGEASGPKTAPKGGRREAQHKTAHIGP
jgi:TetR/AcrR family transcriptional regulator, regulator of autoinduction and epiphytic fitness